jgi:hypothetical protein
MYAGPRKSVAVFDDSEPTEREPATRARRLSVDEVQFGGMSAETLCV